MGVSASRLVGLLYEMGVTFNGLSTTRMAAEEFLRTGNPDVIGSRDDYALLRDLRDAARRMTRYDYSHRSFDLAYLETINGAMTRTAARLPGELRASENVAVACAGGKRYVPPIPDKASLECAMVEAAKGNGSLDDAARLFALLAKAQPFGDGNKRTALLAANGLRIMRHKGTVLSVPSEGRDVERLNGLLSQWYLHDDPRIVEWLAGWNRRRIQKQDPARRHLGNANASRDDDA